MAKLEQAQRELAQQQQQRKMAGLDGTRAGKTTLTPGRVDSGRRSILSEKIVESRMTADDRAKPLADMAFPVAELEVEAERELQQWKQRQQEKPSDPDSGKPEDEDGDEPPPPPPPSPRPSVPPRQSFLSGLLNIELQ
jgi:hypothetical protein